jgi:hypothetical protein
LEDSLGEVFIKIESFGAVVVLLSSHDELVSFDEVLLPHEDPSYFVKSIAVVKFMEVGVNVLSHTFIQILQSLLVIYLLTPLLSLPQNQYALGEVKFSFNCFLLHLHVFLVELRKVYVHTLVQRDGFLEIAEVIIGHPDLHLQLRLMSLNDLSFVRFYTSQTCECLLVAAQSLSVFLYFSIAIP